MSQLYKDLTAGPVPPIVAESYVTDINSPAIPAANVLNVFGNDVTTNNNNGIQTDGSSGSNTLTVQLTNRLQGLGSTVGAVTANLFTFSLGATPASYMFEINVTGFDTVTPSATGYWFIATARTTGAAATVVGSNEDFLEDVGLAASDVDLIASGNNVILRVLGVAGVTLNWNAVGYYVKAT